MWRHGPRGALWAARPLQPGKPGTGTKSRKGGKVRASPRFATLALSRRLPVQETDQGYTRFGCGPPVGNDVPVLQSLPVEGGVVIQILPSCGSFQGKTGKQGLGAR